MNGELRELTPQEKYNNKIRDRYSKKNKKNVKDPDDVKFPDAPVVRDDIPYEETPEVDEALKDERSKKHYMVSFIMYVEPMIKFGNTRPSKKRELVIIEAESFKEARDIFRSNTENRTLGKGGFGGIRITELSKEQAAEYKRIREEQSKVVPDLEVIQE